MMYSLMYLKKAGIEMSPGTHFYSSLQPLIQMFTQNTGTISPYYPSIAFNSVTMPCISWIISRRRFTCCF